MPRKELWKRWARLLDSSLNCDLEQWRMYLVETKNMEEVGVLKKDRKALGYGRTRRR